jgi:hypothetical protein
MTISALAAYLLTAMTTWVPPHEHSEGADLALKRYETIANDIAQVALDENEKPVFAGDNGRVQTALLMAAIASYESFYRADIDEGRRTGDHGRSWCIMQVHVPRKTTAEGFSGRDLVSDRTHCLVSALHLIQESFAVCRGQKVVDRLALYTVGACREEKKAEWRTMRAMAWYKAHPPPKDAASPESSPEPTADVMD